MEFLTVDFPIVPRAVPAPFGPGRRAPAAAPAPGPRRVPARLPPTTDFSPASGQRVLFLADEDNLRISMQERGARLSYKALLQRVQEAAQSVSAWAVLATAAGDGRRAEDLQGQGWNVVAIPQEVVVTVDGPCLKANADMDFCFAAGYLARTGRCDAVVLGSGDGDLCVAVARGIKRMPGARKVYTLSVPGSTSQRLKSRPDLFDGNILIGRDLTHEDL
jgi:hypothetical protein